MNRWTERVEAEHTLPTQSAQVLQYQGNLPPDRVTAAVGEGCLARKRAVWQGFEFCFGTQNSSDYHRHFVIGAYFRLLQLQAALLHCTMSYIHRIRTTGAAAAQMFTAHTGSTQRSRYGLLAAPMIQAPASHNAYLKV